MHQGRRLERLARVLLGHLPGSQFPQFVVDQGQKLLGGRGVALNTHGQGTEEGTSIEWPVVFPWFHHRRTVWSEFARIQQAAGIELPCHERHVHTPACHHYGFHDLRRAFATQNAERLSADTLQALMRHKSYTTTQGYINVAQQVNRAVEILHVPELLQRNGNWVHIECWTDFAMSRIDVSYWPRRDSNPYAPYGTQDFKS